MIKQMDVRRTFIPGDEWIYYKIYAGVGQIDVILTELIKPFVGELLSGGSIKKWFFIRFSDPDHHLRLRFHKNNSASSSKIIDGLCKQLEKAYMKKIFWNVEICTYKRELERYGDEYIELVEDIFFNDSVMVINSLSFISGEETEDLRWQFALKLVDVLLEDFGYGLQGKFLILEQLKKSYYKEFSVNRHLKQQLDKKYRKEFLAIDKALTYDSGHFNNTLLSVIHQRSHSNKEVLDQIKAVESERSINDLLMSIIHMSMNRLFISNQRLNELVIYDFLYRYYKSQLARNKNNEIEHRSRVLGADETDQH